MSSVNDSSNHFIVLDAVSRGMKSMGMIAKVMRVEDHIQVLNILVSQRFAMITGGRKQERNNDRP